ncbi:MAG: hypothetical protein HY063_04290 [Bacteroidetes bacterium]|nr:hypothetical protein [Bacteroidota bacterium]
MRQKKVSINGNLFSTKLEGLFHSLLRREGIAFRQNQNAELIPKFNYLNEDCSALKLKIQFMFKDMAGRLYYVFVSNRNDNVKRIKILMLKNLLRRTNQIAYIFNVSDEAGANEVLHSIKKISSSPTNSNSSAPLSV